MADINIQMKNKIGETWNKLFPKTKISLVEGLPAKLDDVDTRLNAAATKTEVNAKIGVVNEQLAETAKKSEVHSLSVNKAEKTYVDMKIASVASGSPKGVYPTLAALQSDIPAGNSNTYVVTEDGKWYFFNNESGWTAGGKYQSTGLEEGVVNTSNVGEIDASKIKIASVSVDEAVISMYKKMNPYYYGIVTDGNVEGLLTIANYKNNNATVAKNASINGVVLQTLLPDESIINNVYGNLYDAIRFKTLTSSGVIMSSDSARCYYLVSSNNYRTTTNMYNAFASIPKFKPETQLNFSTNVNNFIGYHTNHRIELNVTKTEVVAAGHAFDAAGVKDYMDTLEDFDIYIRRTTTIESIVPFYLLVDSLSVLKDSDTSLSFNLFKKEASLIDAAKKTYSAFMTNDIAENYNNSIVKLYMTFERGECKDETHILVRDKEGNVYPHQWEDDLHVNYKYQDNFGRYTDGSLRSGTIYIIDSFSSADTSKMYYVDVYEMQVTKYAESVTSAISDGTTTITANGCTFDFKAASKYLLQTYTQGESVYTLIQDVAYKKTLAADFSLTTDMSTAVTGKTIAGSGVIFKTLEVKLTNGLFDVIVRTKIFNNGHFEYSTIWKAKRLINATECYGIKTKFSFSAAEDAVYDNIRGGYRWASNGLLKSARVIYAHGDWARDATDPPQPRYREFILWSPSVNGNTSIKRLLAGWEYNSNDIPANIAKGEVFANKVMINLAGYSDSHDKEDARIYNPLISRLTDKTVFTLKRELLKLVAETNVNLQMDYERNYPSGGYTTAGKIALYKAYGMGNLTALNQEFKGYINSIGGNTSEAFWAKYVANDLRITYTSRWLLPPAIMLLDEYKSLNNAIEIEYYENVIKNYANVVYNAFVEKGFLGITYSSESAPANVTGCGMRALATALKIEDNPNWRTAYNGLETYLTSFERVENVIYDSSSATTPIYNYLHYTTYAMFEYLLAAESINKQPIATSIQYVLNATSAYGALKEQEYCISKSRRGALHTYGYVIMLLALKDNPSRLAQAVAVAKHFASQAKVEGGHMFPTDNFELTPAGYSSTAPFAIQVFGEIMQRLLNSNIKL